MQARRPDEAIPVLEDIINNSGAKLLPFEQYSNAFYFDETYEFNSENLYEVDFKHNPKQEGPWGGSRRAAVSSSSSHPGPLTST